VGVFRQVMRKPKPRYQVLGAAFVRDWRDGFFELESVPPSQ
jgi:putative restriction endonuclease